MNRLDVICSMVEDNSIVYDVGCDHGYLLLKLYPKIKYGYALDIAQKPLNTAIKTIKENNIQDKITAVLSDGLEKVNLDLADTIVIAGMGAELIIDIISKKEGVYNNKYTFLLQPMTKSEVLRHFLYKNGFEIIEERISIEERRFYTIIKCRYCGVFLEKNILDCYVSDNLLTQKDFYKYVEYKTNKMQLICDKISDKNNDKYLFYYKIIEKLRGLI